MCPDTTSLGLPCRTAEKRPGVVPGGPGLIGTYGSPMGPIWGDLFDVGIWDVHRRSSTKSHPIFAGRSAALRCSGGHSSSSKPFEVSAAELEARLRLEPPGAVPNDSIAGLGGSWKWRCTSRRSQQVSGGSRSQLEERSVYQVQMLR